MLLEDLCHVDCHRAVQVDGHIGNSFLMHQFTQVVHQFLGSLDRKGGNHDIALGSNRPIDDLFELKQRQKAIFPFLLALPIGAALDPAVYIPFVGEVNLGLWMLVVGPFAITCAANAGNMLEGFNGLGTGLSIMLGDRDDLSHLPGV